jgi:hypothetical protein
MNQQQLAWLSFPHGNTDILSVPLLVHLESFEPLTVYTLRLLLEKFVTVLIPLAVLLSHQCQTSKPSL